MSMTIYGKASRLLCRHLLYQASTKSFLNDAEYFSFYHHLVVVVLHCRLRDGRSWHEIIGSLTVQSCILRVCCAKEKFSPRRRLRLRLRANKNLHIPSGYALGILLHNICPQAMQKFAYANFLCPKAMPGALPEAIFQKFLKFSIF
ncbi:hypothetical protein T4C_12505 [Trichinella pseudospiralis]|uniref:Uncharacterized protein n=1 Tax=Trichinella pseudospiralis TaxID=6337 RepID=A0A0V1K1B9_TRIPS|nr:hypothetical protein T4C_12505 [Trichinella pseudospiralis]